ncbi:organic cation/carnitine transporter 2 [Procambarus clarkii]|uniref:organic cation/carnitine transporter 2 n=1 Tax=Procambarus clarkii TaxID=6728 RepID=UPI001E674947|nr:solute carrier family 22 member 3-like isoform X2 [Procambarus clarkii]
MMAVKNDQEAVRQPEETVPCTSWSYDTSVFHSTVAMEWDLVCERAFLAPLFQTLYTVGSIFGSLFSATAAHKYGIRWAVRAGSLGTLIGLGVLLTTPWFYLLLVSRFFLGVFNVFMVAPSFILAMEVCVPRLRPTVGVMLALPYAIMMIVLTLLAYAIRDWRTLHLAASFPSFLLIPFILVVDESPRWLVVHGYLEEAVVVLQRGARLNRVQLPDPATLSAIISVTPKTSQTSGALKDEKQIQISTIDGGEGVMMSSSAGPGVHGGLKYGSEGGYGVTCDNKLGAEDGVGSWWAGPVALVRSSALRKMMAVLIALWFLQGVVYLGLPLNSSAFSSPFVYMALLGVVEIPAYSLTAPITKHLGRRVVIGVCLILSGSFLFLLYILQLTIVMSEWVDLALVLVSYLLVCTSYQVNYIFVPELLPTTLRPWGSALCIIAANLGYCVPPFFTEYLAVDHPWLPVVVFGLCGVLAGSLVVFLPETNGRPLLETVADLQERLSTKTPKTSPK